MRIFTYLKNHFAGKKIVFYSQVINPLEINLKKMVIIPLEIKPI